MLEAAEVHTTQQIVQGHHTILAPQRKVWYGVLCQCITWDFRSSKSTDKRDYDHMCIIGDQC
ncbi:hypothetical protein BFJ63_vAg11268 [Fusarium oxysporum f. sp. narcissi]|uniref:Uncharacterized protein n=3 Tax=Fusarium oxysporum TaxID=5507 RepID=A0A420RIP2_FUSOX|nr:hypothetical protein BFJ65_g1789 [Fusarium oxysporum f. sp. cepae]RKK97615.1 hypothetical protein BFJ71_g7208 [Fusarium oxysporum]RYC85857.1 hypothetical protein BFJ63_vAg11268 [Fusarium oxysporum f. sp. narcissi]RKK58760.1 hypothetical protein BFJ67_g2774 [Fusarium oxysporum f. sp. cepae]RKL16899.1 hypothetical protein BFJ68_g4986 [Fusarium oxysporum]